jgi:5-keto 4-deoxyuronate isomerase
MELRAPITPEDVQSKDADYLRQKLVINNLFQKNVVTYVQSHHDRILIGGVSLQGSKGFLRSTSRAQRRIPFRAS